MEFIADFHLHSKYSRGTSPKMELENLAQWAQMKGILVLGTGDFTCPFWFEELKNKLIPAEPGLFTLKASNSKTRFILTTEVSCVFLRKTKTKKIHLIIFSPSLEICEKINKKLSNYGDLLSDGRPTLNLDAKDLVKIILNISEDALIVPAHIWTPWFSLFGSRSGFDSMEECFEDLTKYIFAGETGLSSDPAMNWRLSSLDKITLISCSDAHSLEKIGREANVFNCNLDYFSIIDAIKKKDKEKFLYTIEFFPEEGKYHYDGHRNCGISLHPKETKKYNGICPVCGKPLTIGVLNRVEQLADRPEGFVPENAIPFKSLVPLEEIIADALGQKTGTVEVERQYQNLLAKFGNEFNVLLNVSKSDLKMVTLPEIAEGIIRVREGKVFIEPGYDGVYGKIKIFQHPQKPQTSKQGTLF
ncbi:DNA helicase UvrD [Candidatus Parcubacteria bacterium]|nr:DNA helicase UvrD [Candidatus Parcubacteria bacterium]